MKRFYKILRLVFLSLLIILAGVPTGLYMLLSTPWAHEKMKVTLEEQLGEKLGTRVEVERLDFAPFNRLRISGVKIEDDFGEKALSVQDISARFELIHFIRTGKITIDYVALDSLNLRLYRKTKSSPLNIARMMEHLKSKEPNKPAMRFDLALNTVLIDGAHVNYDILDAPAAIPGKFDVNHISVSNLMLALDLPRLSNDNIRFDLEQLSAQERSGLRLINLVTSGVFTSTGLTLDGISLEMPASKINIDTIKVNYNNSKVLEGLLTKNPLKVSIIEGSYVSPADLCALVPQLKPFSSRIFLDAVFNGTIQHLNVETFNLFDRQNGLSLALTGEIANITSPETLKAREVDLSVEAMPSAIIKILTATGNTVNPRLASLLSSAGSIKANITGQGDPQEIDAVANIVSELGNIEAKLYALNENNTWRTHLESTVENLKVGSLANTAALGPVSGDISIDALLKNKELISGEIDVLLSESPVNEVHLGEIALHGQLLADRTFSGSISMENSPAGAVVMDFSGNTTKDNPGIAVNGTMHNLAMAVLGGEHKYRDYFLNLDIDADIKGVTSQWVDGYVHLSNINFTNGEKSLQVKHFDVDASNTANPGSIHVASDFLNGSAQGTFALATLGSDCRNLLARALPSIGITRNIGKSVNDNNLNFNFELSNAQDLSTFFDVPLHVVYPVSITGVIANPEGYASLNIDAPYLQQGDKIIEATVVDAVIDSADNSARAYVTSTIPTQKGVMALSTALSAANDRIDTRIDWMIEREKPINGTLDFSALLDRDQDGKYLTTISVNPGTINFGNAIWTLSPAKIAASSTAVKVDSFAMTAQNQAIRINGLASSGLDSELTVDLENMQLINIFETLDIDKALIGGRATGIFHAKGLLSKEPDIRCNTLHVKDISYNYCVLGDALIKANWDNKEKAFMLDADITGKDLNRSRIYGSITPATESLDITFDANRVPVGFMKPFMEAFAADLSGYASGRARLFGTFKYIDLEGDLMADSLGIKLDFTNTWYYATDSVRIRPGNIIIKDVTMSDAYGHTGLLNGFVKHNFFHDPVFEFRLSDCENILCYDVDSKRSPDWYGRVFGDGGAYITGHPGVVNIDVNMTTAQGSTFTFVLSDTEEADEYTFITFRDKTPVEVRDSIVEVETLPKAVRDYRDRMIAKTVREESSLYNMNIQVDITPAASIILVMDPIGGDRIRSNGQGNLRMTYASAGNELHMYGTYVIDKGSYNFTLQDIIVKDFTIRPGSSIAFTGDPYAARLDIKAAYSVNANLSDLDESFLQDKDLNRTNVPVNALLMAQGDMRQPEVSFDLEFPTLNNDVYRKVRSIVSTEEMMNRQIIYLLALNRFYTPDYMSTTKGNELFSVASSTIASQLSSMLGKLSDNWSIAPNLRSDRGDFSDVEVDVALSSSLLNNRLLFNGNFGYRDKSLNSNQFIGDFDIEYLLNRRGNWRLKAYNRYNDQNYYLRTAQTTQGVGVMFRRDFDRMFNFFRHHKKNTESITDSLKVDSTAKENSSSMNE